MAPVFIQSRENPLGLAYAPSLTCISRSSSAKAIGEASVPFPKAKFLAHLSEAPTAWPQAALSPLRTGVATFLLIPALATDV